MGVHIGVDCWLICTLSAFGTEPYLITIGNDCTITSGVLFLTHDGGMEVVNHLKGTADDKIAPIRIGNNVFLGNDVKIMMGVTIGDNVIVGAGSIVTNNVPSNVVIAGVPAKVICSIEEYSTKNHYRMFPTRNLSSKDKRKFFENKQTYEGGEKPGESSF